VARWYGDAEREASLACARVHGERATSEGVSSGGARGHRGNGTAWAGADAERRGAGATRRDATCRTGDV
jgi:hypothetical protein